MKTSKEFKRNVENRIITSDMLGACIYSVNKRAKNYRDKEWEYREYYRTHRFYHDDFNNVDKCRSLKLQYYNKKEVLLSLLQPTCIHHEKNGGYFLMYVCGSYSFHLPIKAEELTHYNDLTIKEIDRLHTCGEDISDLISMQFVEKVLLLIKSGNYVYLNN